MNKMSYLLICAAAAMMAACTDNPEQSPQGGETPDTPVAPPVGQGDYLLINGSTFTMGSPEEERWRENDETQHQVTVGNYYIAKYEVAQADYEALMGSNPNSFTGDRLPVEGVSWYDAVRYCNALSSQEGLEAAYTINGMEVTWNREANGYRLPTEAEWEYACRAGTTTPFSTGGNITVDQANWYSSYPYIEGEGGGAYRRQTVAVDEFEPNSWGIYNMHGNVSEWCWDYYGEYGAQAQDNPAGPQSGRSRVMRGGGWYDYAKHVRSAYRSAMPADYIDYKIGFRVARNAE